MKIVVDAFGGDKAPLEIVKGVVNSVAKYDIEAILTGDKEKLEKLMSDQELSNRNIELVDAKEIITMEDDPSLSVKTKKDSSLVVAMRILAENKADAFVGAGNTGAVLTAATLIAKRIKGLKRPALAPILPSMTGSFMLLDCGANVTCKPEYLYQFAVMGSIYMNKMYGIQNPKVGLLNNGIEEHKGTELQIETYKLLKNSTLNFVGNVEPKELMQGACDVIVTDGFTGNIFLKTLEGASKMFGSMIKDVLYTNFKTKVGGLLTKREFGEFKRNIDPKEYGGVPLLGISKAVIKAHGNSDARAFENAIKQAVDFYNSRMIEIIESDFSNNNLNS